MTYRMVCIPHGRPDLHQTVTTLNGKKKVKTKTTAQATIPLDVT